MHIPNKKAMKFYMISAKGHEFLERLEGKRAKAYKDSGGKLSIGIGHLITQSERSSGKIKIMGAGVKYSNGLTNDQINDLFIQDISKHEGTVSLAIHDSAYKAWEQHQVDALVSFSFNIGSGAFNKSTLAKYIESGEIGKIPGQLKRWVYDNGEKVQGLVNRRKLEIGLFEKGIYA